MGKIGEGVLERSWLDEVMGGRVSGGWGGRRWIIGFLLLMIGKWVNGKWGGLFGRGCRCGLDRGCWIGLWW